MRIPHINLEVLKFILTDQLIIDPSPEGPYGLSAMTIDVIKAVHLHDDGWAAVVVVI